MRDNEIAQRCPLDAERGQRMIPFHRPRSIAPLTAALIVTLLIAPSAVAEQVSVTPQISQPQESHIENNAVAILGTITDIFSCKHHPALPWCK